jgi:hypothetical protein
MKRASWLPAEIAAEREKADKAFAELLRVADRVAAPAAERALPPFQSRRSSSIESAPFNASKAFRAAASWAADHPSN